MARTFYASTDVAGVPVAWWDSLIHGELCREQQRTNPETGEVETVMVCHRENQVPAEVTEVVEGDYRAWHEAQAYGYSLPVGPPTGTDDSALDLTEIIGKPAVLAAVVAVLELFGLVPDLTP